MTPLLSPLRRTSDVVNRVVIAVCAVLLALMLVISAASVVLELALAAAERVGQAEIFHEGAFAWLYRNTRPSLFSLLLPWFAMLSITVAFKYGEHIAILALRRGLPRAALGLVRWICFTCVCIASSRAASCVAVSCSSCLSPCSAPSTVATTSLGSCLSSF